MDMQVTAQISLSVFFGVLFQATVLWLIGSRFCASTKEHAYSIVQGNLTICKMRWNVPYPTALREGAFDVLEPLDRYIYVMFPIIDEVIVFLVPGHPHRNGAGHISLIHNATPFYFDDSLV